jgi:hypothetical protein
MSRIQGAALTLVQRTLITPKMYDITSYRNALAKTICEMFRVVEELNWFEVYMMYEHPSLPPKDERDIFYIHDLDFYKAFHEVLLGLSSEFGKDAKVVIGIQDLPDIALKVEHDN